jgi:hypothetical protein
MKKILLIVLLLAVSLRADTSSGTSPKATSGDASIALLTAGAASVHLRIVVTNGVAFFFSRDGGTTWNYIPANPSAGPTVVSELLSPNESPNVMLERLPGGTDCTGVYASAW